MVACFHSGIHGEIPRLWPNTNEVHRPHMVDVVLPRLHLVSTCSRVQPRNEVSPMQAESRSNRSSFWPMDPDRTDSVDLQISTTAVPTSTAAVNGTVISTEDQTPWPSARVTNGTWNLEWESTSSWEGKPDKMSFKMIVYKIRWQ